MKVTRKNFYIGVFLCIYLLRSSAFMLSLPLLGDLTRVVMVYYLPFFAVYYLQISKKMSLMVMNVILFYGVLAVSTLMFSKSYGDYLTYMVQGVGLTIICQYYMDRNAYNYINLVRRLIVSFILLNVLTQILIPGGIPRGDFRFYFIGSRISFFQPYILGLYLCFVCEVLEYGELKLTLETMLLYAACIVSFLAERVTTGLIAMAILTMMLPLLKARIYQFFDYTFLTVIALGAWFLIVIAFQTSYLGGVLGAFGEDLTFNSRTLIWRSALFHIIRSPIWGYGITASGSFDLDMGSGIGVYGFRRPAHDQLLHVLYEGGAVAAVVYLLMLVVIGISVYKCKNRSLKYVTSCVMFVFNVASIVEIQSQRGWMFIMFAVMAHIDKLDKYIPKKGARTNAAKNRLSYHP